MVRNVWHICMEGGKQQVERARRTVLLQTEFDGQRLKAKSIAPLGAIAMSITALPATREVPQGFHDTVRLAGKAFRPLAIAVAPDDAHAKGRSW